MDESAHNESMANMSCKVHASRSGKAEPSVSDEHLDVVRKASRAVTAPRTYVFDDPDVERLLDIVLALTGELAVTQERLDTVMQLLAAKNLVEIAEVERFQPDAQAAKERLARHEALLARVLRVLHQDIAGMEAAAAGQGGGEAVRGR